MCEASRGDKGVLPLLGDEELGHDVGEPDPHGELAIGRHTHGLGELGGGGGTR